MFEASVQTSTSTDLRTRGRILNVRLKAIDFLMRFTVRALFVLHARRGFRISVQLRIRPRSVRQACPLGYIGSRVLRAILD